MNRLITLFAFCLCLICLISCECGNRRVSGNDIVKQKNERIQKKEAERIAAEERERQRESEIRGNRFKNLLNKKGFNFTGMYSEDEMEMIIDALKKGNGTITNSYFQAFPKSLREKMTNSGDARQFKGLSSGGGKNQLESSDNKEMSKQMYSLVQGTWTSGLLDANEFPELRGMENSSMGKVRMSVIVKGSRATLFYYDSITQVAFLQSDGSCIIYDNGEGGELRLSGGYNLPFYIDTNLDREQIMHIGNYKLKKR